jgi:fido (protein-threonine AMPylation protein)
MIDATDFTIPGTGVLRNKMGVTDPTVFSRRATESTAIRLAELRQTPVRGGFDATHLQAIHHHIYQDLYDWAGELRLIDAGNVPASQVEKTLNSTLDRLSRENHLKGLSAEEWASSASAYIYDLGAIQPFLAGNEIALHEFAVELARKNNLSLQWDTSSDIATDSIELLSQAEQSANLRRLIMLAMDTDPIAQHFSHGRVVERELEKSLQLDCSNQ